MDDTFSKHKFKAIIKALLYYLPNSVGSTVASRLRRRGLIGAQHEVFLRIGSPQSVLSGPFKGMRYIVDAVGSAWLPKVLGIYEMELHSVIEQLISEPCDVIIDVGSAEGYYAVGLSLRLRPQKTWAFDTNPRANLLVRNLAAANDLADIVQPDGFCDTERLEKVLQTAKFPLLVCDCEGYETELLNPAKVPSLAKCRVLVEAHDEARDGPVISTLRNRFDISHSIETVIPRKRSAQDLPQNIASLVGEGDHVADAISEHRIQVTDWLVMRPKNK
jgi:hypothetical protein